MCWKNCYDHGIDFREGDGCPVCSLVLEQDALRVRVAELEAENATLRAHRCEVGCEDPKVMLAHLQSLPPEEIEAIKKLFNRK